jgi:hypothetical protein
MDLLDQHFRRDICSLFHLAHVSNYFLFEGQYYEQKDGVPMESSVFPVMPNDFMEHIEAWLLDTAALKPSCWYSYVDDTFVIWPHGHMS